MMEEEQQQQHHQQPATVLLPHLSASGAWHSLKSMTWLCDEYLDNVFQQQSSLTNNIATNDTGNEVSLDLNGSENTDGENTTTTTAVANNTLRKRSEYVLENGLIKDVQLKRAHRGWRLKAQVCLIDRPNVETDMYDEEGGGNAIVTGSWHTCTMVVERADPKTCACDCHNAAGDSEHPFCEHISALLMIANMIRSYAMPYTSATAAFWQKLEDLRIWLFTPMVESTPTTAATAAAVIAAMPVMRRPRGRPPKSAIHPNHPTRSAAPLSSSVAIHQQQQPQQRHIIPVSLQQEDADEEAMLSQQEEEVILELSTAARHTIAMPYDEEVAGDEEARRTSTMRRGGTASSPSSSSSLRTTNRHTMQSSTMSSAPSNSRMQQPQMSNAQRRPAVSNTLKYARITKRAILNLANDRLNRDFGEWVMENFPTDAISDFIQRCRSRFVNQIVDSLTDEDMRHIETLLGDGMTRAEFKTEVMSYRDMLKQPKRDSTIQKHEALLASKNQQQQQRKNSGRRQTTTAAPSSSRSGNRSKASSSSTTTTTTAATASNDAALMMDDSSSDFYNASPPPSSHGMDDTSDCYSQMTIMTRPSSPTSWGFNDDDVLLPVSSDEVIDEDAASQDATSFADMSTSFFYDDDMSIGGDNDDHSVYEMDDLSPQYDSHSHYASPTNDNRSAGKRPYSEAFPSPSAAAATIAHDEEEDEEDNVSTTPAAKRPATSPTQ